MNEIERIVATPGFGPHHHPQLFRLLRDSTLYFLLRDPDAPGEHALPVADALSKIVVWSNKTDGRQIPVFSSIDRAQEAVLKVAQKRTQPGARIGIAGMEGKLLFDLLRHQKQAVVLNPMWEHQALSMDTNLVRMLADGSALAPDSGRKQEGTVQIIKPADYPTEFLAPLSTFLSGRPEIKAAWVFRRADAPDDPLCYIFVLKIAGPDTGVQQDFRIVANSSRPPGVAHAVTLLDPNNPGMVKLTSAAAPFYTAPDYKPAARPPGAAPGKS